jgi:hypothetical protein
VVGGPPPLFGQFNMRIIATFALVSSSIHIVPSRTFKKYLCSQCWQMTLNRRSPNAVNFLAISRRFWRNQSKMSIHTSLGNLLKIFFSISWQVSSQTHISIVAWWLSN